MKKAWHFVGETLRDGRPVPADGEVLIHNGPLVMCETGLHASERIIDALQYAPGNTICRVECGGEIIDGTDKMVCTERTILWRVDGERLLREFTRCCISNHAAKNLRNAAWAAARDAARDAAWDAAWAAARDADWDAAWAAARDAARDAAWDAAWDAARDAARDAAWAAARAEQNRRLEQMVREVKAEAENK